MANRKAQHASLPCDNCKVGTGSSRSPSIDETWRTRLYLCYSIPHALTLSSMFFLTIFISSTAHSETARQLKANELAQRCAFVYLASSNQTDIQNLGFSLQSLNRHFKFETNYRIIIAHESIPPVVQGRLQSLSEAPVEFRPVYATGPKRQNTTAETEKSQQRSFAEGQATGLSWFHTTFLHEPSKTDLFADLDYIVRLDENSAFTRDVPEDFVKSFVTSGAQYGYQNVTTACMPNFADDFKKLVTSYVDLNGITPRSEFLWASVVHPRADECLPRFHNQLEIVNLRFFRSHSGIQDWIQAVDANVGIFRNKWSDGVLQYITVGLYAAPENIVRYSAHQVPYEQQTNQGRGVA